MGNKETIISVITLFPYIAKENQIYLKIYLYSSFHCIFSHRDAYITIHCCSFTLNYCIFLLLNVSSLVRTTGTDSISCNRGNYPWSKEDLDRLIRSIILPAVFILFHLSSFSYHFSRRRTHYRYWGFNVWAPVKCGFLHKMKREQSRALINFREFSSSHVLQAGLRGFSLQH